MCKIWEESCMIYAKLTSPIITDNDIVTIAYNEGQRIGISRWRLCIWYYCWKQWRLAVTSTLSMKFNYIEGSHFIKPVWMNECLSDRLHHFSNFGVYLRKIQQNGMFMHSEQDHLEVTSRVLPLCGLSGLYFCDLGRHDRLITPSTIAHRVQHLSNYKSHYGRDNPKSMRPHVRYVRSPAAESVQIYWLYCASKCVGTSSFPWRRRIYSIKWKVDLHLIRGLNRASSTRCKCKQCVSVEACQSPYQMEQNADCRKVVKVSGAVFV